jgi:hypothetical protein
MGVYIELKYLKAPRPFKLFLVPFVLISNYYITAVSLSAEVNLWYAYYNPGKTEAIIRKRAELQKQIALIQKAICGMTHEEFTALFEEMTHDDVTSAQKLKNLFIKRESTPTPDFEEKWQEQLAGIIGIIGAGLSTYPGTVPLSKGIGDWISRRTDNEDAQTNTFLQDLISIGSYVPYFILCAKAAHYQFKNIVTPWVHDHLPGSPVKTALPNLRKWANRAAPVIGLISAVPNSYWGFALIKPPAWAIALGVDSLLVPGALYTAFTKELFKRGINLYESYYCQSNAVLHQKLIDDVAFLDVAIGQMPDDDVEALHDYVKDPAVTDLIARQFEERKNKRGFFNRTVHPETVDPNAEANLSLFQRFTRKIWPK